MTDKEQVDMKVLQQKYMELQMVQTQVQQVQKQAQMLEAQASEMDSVEQALDDFTRAKPGDAFVTLTPGLFVKARVENTERVLLNVGGGAVVEKSVGDAKKIVHGQGLELRKLQEDLMLQLQKLAGRAEGLQDEMKSLVK
ncbi:prefoldin subunit alpha [Candidatus Woesearchaeota archaeon]|nr:prefoldin subunit alpha [Candidatus Woesearchaeota archaeon]